MNYPFFLKEEEKFLSNFFGQKIDLKMPEISEEEFEKFSRLGFDCHFLPKIEITEDKNFPGWKEKPKKNFFNLIRKEKLSISSISLPGKWVFIEKRKKPKKNFWWITKDDPLVIFLKKIGFDLKKYCQKVNCQQYEDDFFLPILKENHFSSRFSLTWQEIDKIIRPGVAKLLEVQKERIRLPRFIEWNFLANIFYQEWGKTSTWEWFSDRLSTGECLSGGSNSLSALGWDPPDFWSTMLGFRILVEV